MAADEKSPDAPPASSQSTEATENHKAYWKANIRLVLFLLVIWFLFGCVFSILMVDNLNQVTFGGFKLGFWISQQGTILVFIGLIFTYAFLLQKLDRKHGVEDEGHDELPEDH